jgi:hypothetical protein
MWDTIAAEAAAESRIWGDALRSDPVREPVFSPLAHECFRLGLETIYEGYLVHYGTPRVFEPPDPDTALLLGDYLYAHGLVRIANVGDVAAVSDLSELISLCSQLRAEDADGDAALWAATSSLLGQGMLEEARAALRLHGDASQLDAAARVAVGDEAVERALAAHSGRVG